MTETSTHTSEVHSLSERDRKMLQDLRDTLDNEGSSQDPNGDMDSLLPTPAETEPVTSNPDTAPRMTDSLQEALQDFRMTNGTSGVDRAHSDALKEYRKRDIEDYTSHIATLAGQEEAGDLQSGRTYRNLLLREDIQTSLEEKLSSTANKTRTLGKLALLHTSAFVTGLARKGMDKANAKITDTLDKHAAYKKTKMDQTEAIKMNKSFDRKRKQDHSEAIRMNQDFDRKARWDKRRERYESLKESTLSPARKIGRFAIDAHTVGLEMIDPEAAKKAKLRRSQKIQSKKVYNISSPPSQKAA